MTNFMDKFGNLISPKKTNDQDAHITRLKKMAEVERMRTTALQAQYDKQKEIEALQGEVMGEQKTQKALYDKMGIDPPEIVKKRKTRQYIIMGVALFLILLIIKGCF